MPALILPGFWIRSAIIRNHPILSLDGNPVFKT
jgi:hypothetical protein